MKHIIAMHGWCCDSTFWESWENHFQLDEWLWESANRGYGSRNTLEPNWGNIQNYLLYKRIIICHSLGIHLISPTLLQEASHVVLINSFSRFIPDGRESRAIKAALHGMSSHIGQTTEKNMIERFYFKANQPYIDPYIIKKPLEDGISSQGREKLKLDLKVLMNSHKLPTGLNKNANVLVINGEQDQIITSATRHILIKDLKEHLDNPPLHWSIKDEGHFIHHSKLINRVKSWVIEA